MDEKNVAIDRSGHTSSVYSGCIGLRVPSYSPKKSKGAFAVEFPNPTPLMIVGWIATEGITDASGTSLGEAGEWAHLAVMILFAASITLQLKRSSKQA